MNLTGPISGEWAALAASLTWAVSTVIYGTYKGSLRPTWMTLSKGLVAVVCLLFTILVTGGFSPVTWSQYGLLAFSGLVGVALGDTAFYAAMPHIGGGLTSAIQCVAPPLTALGAIFILNENLTVSQASGLILTCACIAALILMERPPRKDPGDRPQEFRKGVCFALVAAFCQAAGVLLSRGPLSSLNAAEGALHRMLLATFVVFGFEWFRAGRSLRSLHTEARTVPHRVRLVLAALCGSYFGLIFMVYGITHAPVGVALAITSSYPVWVALIEYYIFGRSMKVTSFICLFGAVLGLFVLLAM